MKTLFRMAVAGALGALLFGVLVKLGGGPEGALAVSILAACVLLVLLGRPGPSTPVPIIDARTLPKDRPSVLPGEAVVVTHGPGREAVDIGDLANFDAAELERRMAYMRARTPLVLADSPELTLEYHYDPPDSWLPGYGRGLMIGADGCVYEAVRSAPVAPKAGEPLKTELEFTRRDDLGRWALVVEHSELVVYRVGMDVADEGPSVDDDVGVDDDPSTWPGTDPARARAEEQEAHERVMRDFDTTVWQIEDWTLGEES